MTGQAIICLPILALLAAGQTQIPAQGPVDTPSEITGEETIAGAPESHDRMTVPVTIAGRGPYRFMIDTGAEATVITRGMDRELQLPSAGRALLVATASQEMVDLVALDGLELGSRVIDNLAAPVLERENIGADGILGLDSLQGLRVLLDFRDHSVAVASAAELGGNKGYEIVVSARRRDGQLLISDAMVDGVRTAVVIDTGAQGSTGNLALRRLIRAHLAGTSISTDVHGNQLLGDVGLIRHLAIEGMALNNLDVTYADTPAFEALGLTRRPALTLGMKHLRMFERVAIDFDTRRILFDLPSGTNRRPLDQLFASAR